MNTKFLEISWSEVKKAIATGLIVALIVVLVHILDAGSIFGLEWRVLLDSAVMAFIGFIANFLNSLLTTSSGTLLGVDMK